MPYGIAKTKGGDSAANVKRMDDCVQAVMKKGNSRLRSILICKKSLGFTKGK